MPCCAVVSCPNYHPKTRGNVTYHRFPADEEIRKKWLRKCGRDTRYDCNSSRVCSIHFCEDDFERDLQGELLGLPLRKRLKKGVEPHLNLVEIKEEPRDTDEEEEVSTRDEWLKIENVELDSSTINGSNERNVEANIITVEQLGELTTSSMPVPVASAVNYMPSSLPASQNWPGDYGFEVSFGPQEKTTKGIAWTYSKIKDKLYVGKDAPCPINFSANTIMPDDVVIRAMALYSSPEQVSDVVHRCVNHSMEEIRKGILEAEHLVRCESSRAVYEKDERTGRHSVVVPFENPPVGQKFATYIYKFVCFGSCSGGPNRRPLMVVFTLERGKQILGRRKLDVKICACPGRDRKSEEQQCIDSDEPVSNKRKESELTSDPHEFCRPMGYPFSKKAKTKKDGSYKIVVDDSDCYEFLKQMKLYFEFYKFMSSLSPDMKKAFLSFQKMRDEESD